MLTCYALLSLLGLAQATIQTSPALATWAPAGTVPARTVPASPVAASPAAVSADLASADPASDDAAVRVPLDNYLRGHATGDPAFTRKAFLPTAHIEGVRDGKFVSLTVDEYCSRFTGKPAADEPTRKRSIDRVDVYGTAAMAKVTLVYGPTTLTDYFVLLKVDGEWKIANKVYAGLPTR